MKAHHVAAAMLLFLAGSLIQGCNKSEPAPTTGPSKVALTLDWKPEPEFGGFYAAQQSGAFGKQNLDVEIKIAGEGADVWQLVGSGKSDFGTTAADQVIIGRSRGADVVAIFAVYQTFPQGIMVHKARGFTGIADVFNHDGFLDAEADTWLKFLTQKYPNPKVQIKGYDGGIVDFLANPSYSQQCFVTSEPILAKRKGSDPQTFLIADEGYNPYTTVVICKADLLKSDPAKVKAMVTACQEGWRAYQDDPSAANAIMGGLNKEMDADTFKEAAAAQKPLIETDETKANGLGTMTKARWDTLAAQLVSLKVVATAPKAEDCFVNP